MAACFEFCHENNSIATALPLIFQHFWYSTVSVQNLSILFNFFIAFCLSLFYHLWIWAPYIDFYCHTSQSLLPPLLFSTFQNAYSMPLVSSHSLSFHPLYFLIPCNDHITGRHYSSLFISITHSFPFLSSLQLFTSDILLILSY